MTLPTADSSRPIHPSPHLYTTTTTQLYISQALPYTTPPHHIPPSPFPTLIQVSLRDFSRRPSLTFVASMQANSDRFHKIDLCTFTTTTTITTGTTTITTGSPTQLAAHALEEVAAELPETLPSFLCCPAMCAFQPPSYTSPCFQLP